MVREIAQRTPDICKFSQKTDYPNKIATVK